MRKKIYEKDPKIQLILANWPKDTLTYKQLYAYGQRIGIEITSKDIYHSIAGFKHLGLVETKQISGTVQITISKDLRNFKPETDLEIPLPTLEAIKEISPFKSVIERKRTLPAPPKMTYLFAIRCVVATFKPGTEFCPNDVLKILEKRGIRPKGKHNQVQPGLSSLFKKDILYRVRRGQPTIYKVTQSFYDYYRSEKNSMISSFPEWKSHYETNFQEPEPTPEPEPKVQEVVTEQRTEPDEVLTDQISPADFGAAMFEYMLELRSGNGVKEVQRLRTKLEDSQLKAHNLHLEINSLKAKINKLDDIKSRQENQIKDLTTELHAAQNDATVQKNTKKTFSMRDVAVIKGRKDEQPTDTVAFSFGT